MKVGILVGTLLLGSAIAGANPVAIGQLRGHTSNSYSDPVRDFNCSTGGSSSLLVAAVVGGLVLRRRR